MPRTSAKILHLYSTSNARPANPAWRRREMTRDIQSLQELAHELQHMKAPLRQASNAFIKATTPDARSEVELKLHALDALVTALGSKMETLVEAITMHQGPAADDAPLR